MCACVCARNVWGRKEWKRTAGGGEEKEEGRRKEGKRGEGNVGRYEDETAGGCMYKSMAATAHRQGGVSLFVCMAGAREGGWLSE